MAAAYSDDLNLPGLAAEDEVVIKGEPGYLFRDHSGTSFCFVPVDCLAASTFDELRLDEVKYVARGWVTRNARVRRIEISGKFAFPDLRHPVKEFARDEVREFLRLIG